MIGNRVVALLLLVLPFYFETGLGIYLPAIATLLFLPCVLLNSSLRTWVTIALGYYLILLLAHFGGLAPIRSSQFYSYRIAAICLFLLAYACTKLYYDDNLHMKFYKASFALACIYSFFAAFSFMFGYQQLLLPGTGSPFNVSPNGIFRAGTFGEGNYFGCYLALSAMVFNGKIAWQILCLLFSLIAASPFASIVIVTLVLHNLNHRFPAVSIKQLIVKVTLLVIGGVSLAAFGYQFIETKLNSFDIDQLGDKSSFIERTGFVLAGFSMWLQYPFFGIGLGQFSEHLSNYTDLPHLIRNEEGFRYIANNNLAEILSEQGMYGFASYVYVLIDCTRNMIGSSQALHIVLIIVLGMAMPSFYLTIVAASLGILASRKPHVRALAHND